MQHPLPHQSPARLATSARLVQLTMVKTHAQLAISVTSGISPQETNATCVQQASDVTDQACLITTWVTTTASTAIPARLTQLQPPHLSVP